MDKTAGTYLVSFRDDDKRIKFVNIVHAEVNNNFLILNRDNRELISINLDAVRLFSFKK